MERFNPARFEFHKDENTFTYVFVGRIFGDKGINELVEAFTKLHDKYNQTRLVFVGRYEENLDPVKTITLQRIEATRAIDACGARYGDELLQMRCIRPMTSSEKTQSDVWQPERCRDFCNLSYIDKDLLPEQDQSKAISSELL